MAAVCTAQHQHQGLGYCQNRFQPDSERHFLCLITYQPEDALTATLHANTTAFPQCQESSQTLCPSRWLPLRGKFWGGGI